MIKDADSFFRCEIFPQNSITIMPLDRLKRVNLQNKSYIALDDKFHITNIIEKKIISRNFCTGGYIFEDAEKFYYYYTRVQKYHALYLSHIIFFMLLDKIIFIPIQVTEYIDWGTKEDWQEHR
jgi:hypothetical protein